MENNMLMQLLVNISKDEGFLEYLKEKNEKQVLLNHLKDLIEKLEVNVNYRTTGNNYFNKVDDECIFEVIVEDMENHSNEIENNELKFIQYIVGSELSINDESLEQKIGSVEDIKELIQKLNIYIFNKED